MKKIKSLIGLIALLTIVGCQNEPLSSESGLTSTDAKFNNEKTFEWPNCEGTASVVDLYAGQNILVGNVEVTVNGDNYEITYNITNPGYCLSATHLSVVGDPSQFPVNNGGNPQIGQFEYSMTHDCVSSYTYEVPTSKGTYIAAHGVVNCKTEGTSSELFLNSIPSQAYACVTAKGGEGQDSYFDILVGGSTVISGPFNAWCTDYDTSLQYPQCFTGDVYTTLDALPASKFEHPETMGAVNWILNQNFYGQGYNYAEIQFAIWKLIEGEELYTEYYGPYTGDYLTGGREIYDLAVQHLDYVPVCGENIGIILIPNNGLQSIIYTIPYECQQVGECEETAWGAAQGGCGFPGNSWATFFHYGE